MLKRLESSWYSFNITVERIYNHHENALNKITLYQELKKDTDIDEANEIDEELIDEDNSGILDSFFLGKKNPIRLSDIDAAGNIEDFKNAIKKDKKSLKYIIDNVLDFKKKIEPERSLKSEDLKLEELLNIIIEKQKTKNKKIVIFSAYKDTVDYLYSQLRIRGFKDFAMVTGDENNVWNEINSIKKHNIILERFAPYTKLFNEKNWSEFKPSAPNLSSEKIYSDWYKYIKLNLILVLLVPLLLPSQLLLTPILLPKLTPKLI